MRRGAAISATTSATSAPPQRPTLRMRLSRCCTCWSPSSSMEAREERVTRLPPPLISASRSSRRAASIASAAAGVAGGVLCGRACWWGCGARPGAVERRRRPSGRPAAGDKAVGIHSEHRRGRGGHPARKHLPRLPHPANRRSSARGCIPAATAAAAAQQLLTRAARLSLGLKHCEFVARLRYAVQAQHLYRQAGPRLAGIPSHVAHRLDLRGWRGGAGRGGAGSRGVGKCAGCVLVWGRVCVVRACV